MKTLKELLSEAADQIFKVRQNRKIRYGTFIKGDSDSVYLSRMFSSHRQ